MRHLTALVVLALLNGGCFKFSERKREDKDTGGAKSVDADSDGVVTTRYDAQQKSAFEVSAGNAGAISGAGITIPPGALSVDTNVSMQEGAAIVSDASAQDLGISDVSAAGPAVLFGAEDPAAKLSGKVAITLPISDSSSLRLASCSAYTVFFRIKDATGQITSGALAAADLTVSETNVKFDAEAFGVFQAACIGKALEAAVTKATTGPIISKKQEQALTPVTFTVGDPKIDATGRIYSITVSATGLDADAKCFATIDQDKLTPADKVVSLVLGQPLAIPALGDQAHSLFMRASCTEAGNGRTSKSDWSKEMAFPAKGSGTGTGTTDEPAVTISTPASGTVYNAGNYTSATVSGTCSPSGTVVQIVVGTATSTATCNNLAYSRTVTLAGVADSDSVTITVKPQGGAASAAKSVVVKKHATVPAKPVVTDVGVATKNKPAFFWTAVSGLTYEIEVSTTSNITTADIDHSTNAVSPYTVAGTPANGVMYAKIIARDAWGNISPWSDPTDGIDYDTVAPAIPSGLSVTPSGPVTENTSPVFSWTNGGAGVKYDIRYGSSSGDSDLGTATDLTSPTHTYNFATTEGLTVYAQVRAKDAVGNTSDYSSALSIRFDTTDPTFQSFTSTTSTTVPGGVDVAVTLGNDIAGFSQLKVVRTMGKVAAADCSSGFSIAPPIANPAVSSTHTFADVPGGTASMWYSYTACLTDVLGRTAVVKKEGASAVHPRDNAGPGCKRPPCDLPKGSGSAPFASAWGSGAFIAGSADYRMAVLGDLDNDGDLDVVFSAGSANSFASIPIRYALNNGSGAFGSPIDVQANVPTIAYNMILADFDGNGYLDVAAAGKIYYGASGLAFSAPTTLPTPGCAGAMAAGDLNGDGRLDLVCSATNTIVFFQQSNGTFSAGQALGTADSNDSVVSHGVTIGDLDNDGRLDVVTAKDAGGGSGAYSRIYLNSPSGIVGIAGFNLQFSVTMVTKSIGLIDLDVDGFLDFVAFNGNAGGDYFFLNDQTGHPTTLTKDGIPFTTTGTSVEFGRLANFTGANGSVATVGFGPSGICSASWNGSAFGAAAIVSTTIDYAFGGDVGDLNGDGELDFVAAHYGYSSGDVRAFLFH